MHVYISLYLVIPVEDLPSQVMGLAFRCEVREKLTLLTVVPNVLHATIYL